MYRPFSILYLEDEASDACEFAEMIQDIFQTEYGEKEMEPFLTSEAVNQYLGGKGIDWIEHYRQFLECLEQPEKFQNYTLFLMDMKMEGEGGVRGWEMIEKIREKCPCRPSPIWILSNYSFFAQPAKKEYRIQHFFTKSAEGYSRLRDELIDRFLPVTAVPPKQYLEFPDSMGQVVRIPVSQIVSVEVVNRRHYLYQLDAKGIMAHKRGFPPHKIFEIAKKQIEEKAIHDLVQISHTAIINTKLVEHIQGSGKRYFVWLSQRGDNKPLAVSYTYLKKLKEIYGDPLPLF